uniref:Cullin family profile domain-containing protein n=1 Tax=Oryza rufipogon TaxID=4529 RepID=A0A0E0N1F1_ORYRU
MTRTAIARPPPMDIEDGWRRLAAGFEKLLRILDGEEMLSFSGAEYSELLQITYKLCYESPAGHAAEMYDRWDKTIRHHIVYQVLPSLQDMQGEPLLKNFVHHWENHKVLMKWLKSVCMYLRLAFTNQRSLPPIMDIALNLFKNVIEEDRAGKVSKKCSSKTQQNITEERPKLGCPVVIKSIQEEEERIQNYLKPWTEARLSKTVLLELVSRQAEWLLDDDKSGFRGILAAENDLLDDGKDFWWFIVMAIAFQQHIRDILQQAVGAAHMEKGKEPSNSIVEVLQKYEAHVINNFDNHILFRKALDENFRMICNRNIADFSDGEFFIIFLERLIEQRTCGKLDDDSVEDTLAKVVKLLPYLHSKDYLVELYRNRLLGRLSIGCNIEVETSFITKLKLVLDVSILEDMLEDYSISKELQKFFKDYMSMNPESNTLVDMDTMVLKQGHFPSQQKQHLSLPPDMLNCAEAFEKFYQEFHGQATGNRRGRTLTWIYSLGNCNIVGNFEGKSVEMIVSPMQAALLLLFNEDDRLSYNDIVAKLEIMDNDAKVMLYSLSCGKYSILKKEPSNKTIAPDDIFEFNNNFSVKTGKIKVPLHHVDRGDFRASETMEDVRRYRKQNVDCAIVRIMKDRKTLDHEKLVEECKKLCDPYFKVDDDLIQMRIDHLVAENYLARKEGCTYEYLP